MASSLVFSSNVISFNESPNAGYMGHQRPPAGSGTRSTNVRFRRCFKVRSMQASVGAEAAISAQGHTESRNLYEVLAISPAATAKDIKRAYRKLAREFHPDHAASPREKNESTQMFLRIHNAYVTLSDPDGRAQYDRQLLAPARGFTGQMWSKATNGRPPVYTYSGHVGRSWDKMAAPAPTKKTFTIGTRKSKLALLQTDLVRAALQKTHPEYEFKTLTKETAGDLNTTIALKDFASKNLWTEELEELMIGGEVDFIVHSLKDVPTLLPETCTLGMMMTREDSRDVFVVKQGLPYKSLAELPAGSVVGTSSIRRTAQLARKYPHLKVQDIRGNIGTRLSKLDADDSPYTCAILAAAGLLRLDLQDRITQYLDSKNSGMLYAVGQGALGIEIRKEDTLLKEMLTKIGHAETTFACLAERSLLRTLEGGCSAPLGVESEWVQIAGSKKLRMRSVVVSVDGQQCAEVEVDGDVDSAESAEAFGVTVAKALVEKGAGAILEEIQRNKVAKASVTV